MSDQDTPEVVKTEAKGFKELWDAARVEFDAADRDCELAVGGNFAACLRFRQAARRLSKTLTLCARDCLAVDKARRASKPKGERRTKKKTNPDKALST